MPLLKIKIRGTTSCCLSNALRKLSGQLFYKITRQHYMIKRLPAHSLFLLHHRLILSHIPDKSLCWSWWLLYFFHSFLELHIKKERLKATLWLLWWLSRGFISRSVMSRGSKWPRLSGWTNLWWSEHQHSLFQPSGMACKPKMTKWVIWTTDEILRTLRVEKESPLEDYIFGGGKVDEFFTYSRHSLHWLVLKLRPAVKHRNLKGAIQCKFHFYSASIRSHA